MEILAEMNMVATGEPTRVRSFIFEKEHPARGAEPLWTKRYAWWPGTSHSLMLWVKLFGELGDKYGGFPTNCCLDRVFYRS